MPALPLFFLIVTVTLIVITLWLIARAPEGIETEDGFQFVNPDQEQTDNGIDFEVTARK